MDVLGGAPDWRAPEFVGRTGPSRCEVPDCLGPLLQDNQVSCFLTGSAVISADLIADQARWLMLGPLAVETVLLCRGAAAARPDDPRPELVRPNTDPVPVADQRIVQALADVATIGCPALTLAVYPHTEHQGPVSRGSALPSLLR